MVFALWTVLATLVTSSYLLQVDTRGGVRCSIGDDGYILNHTGSHQATPWPCPLRFLAPKSTGIRVACILVAKSWLAYTRLCAFIKPEFQ